MRAFIVSGKSSINVYYGCHVVVAENEEKALQLAAQEFKGYGGPEIREEIDLTQPGFHYVYSE